MADNLQITPGSGATAAADDVGGVLHQRVKLSLGADGSATDALGGAGAVAAGVQRVTLASDDPAVAALATIDGRVDGLETLVTSTNTKLDTAIGHVDGIETLVTSTNTKLDSINSNVNDVQAAVEAVGATLTDHSGYLNGLEGFIGDTSDAAATAGSAGSLSAKLRLATTQLNTIIGHVDGVETKLDSSITQETAVNTVLGTTAGSAVVNDSNGTVHQYLRGLVKRWADALGAGTADAALRTTLASNDPVVTFFGAKADAKSTATDTTSVSAMQVFKQISASAQAIATSVASNVLGAGSAVIGAVKIDQTTPGTTDRVTAGGDTQVVTVTPTVQATPDYSSNDVLGGKQTIANAARVAAGSGVISFISVSSNVATLSAIRIVFFKSDPSSTTFSENGTFSLDEADRTKVLAHVDLGPDELADLGTSDILTKTNINVPFKLASGTSLYAVCLARDTINLDSASELTFNYGILRD